MLQDQYHGQKLAWGMELMGTDQQESILEDLYDSKALLAWGPRGAVLAFRGTFSFKNAITDIRVSS